MTALHKTPTSQLLAELNERAEQRFFLVAEMPGHPMRPSEKRYAIYVEGETRMTVHGLQQLYRAHCTRQSDANNIADLLNEQERQRAEAAKQ